MPPKWSGLNAIHDCGRVLGTFLSKEEYIVFKDDKNRFKLYRKVECPQCGKKIVWEKCVGAIILETEWDVLTKAARTRFEKVKLSKKDIEDLGKPEKPDKDKGKVK